MFVYLLLLRALIPSVQYSDFRCSEFLKCPNIQLSGPLSDYKISIISDGIESGISERTRPNSMVMILREENTLFAYAEWNGFRSVWIYGTGSSLTRLYSVERDTRSATLRLICHTSKEPSLLRGG